MLWWIFGVLALSMVPAQAQTVRAVDGDTIKMDGTSWRIWGIDAPETHQACADGWMGGQAAATLMRGMIEGRKIECEAKAKDRYGRTVGLCRVDGRDLGAAMVEAGMAWAFVRYSRDYVDLEREAKAAGLGVHAHGCQAAWEWRAERR